MGPTPLQVTSRVRPPLVKGVGNIGPLFPEFQGWPLWFITSIALWGPQNLALEASKQNRNFRPKGEGRSGHRPLLPKRKLDILVDLTLGKSYHSVVTFLYAQKIKCYTFSIQTSSKLISYYVCLWKVGPWVSYFFIRQCRNRVAKYLWSGGYQA